jgi:hypothetical protein
MTRTLNTRADIPLLQQYEFLFQQAIIAFVRAYVVAIQRPTVSMAIITT